MAKKKSNASSLAEKRRETIAKKNKIANIIAYTTAGVAVAAIIAIIIISYL